MKNYFQRIPTLGDKIDPHTSFQDAVLYQLVYPDLKNINPKEQLTKEQKNFLSAFLLRIYPQKRSSHLEDIQRPGKCDAFCDTVFTDTESYNFYTCQGLKIAPQLKNMTKHFDLITWLSILLSFAMVWASTEAAIKMFGLRLQLSNVFRLLAPVLNTSWGSGIDQPYRNWSLKTYLRIIFASWLLMTMVANNVYQIIVISDFVEPVPPKIRWNIFREIPSDINKNVVLDKSITSLEKDINIVYFKDSKTNETCVRKEYKNPTSAISPWQFGRICKGSILYTESPYTILTWHLSSFGQSIRDSGLDCFEVFKNKSEISFAEQFKKACQKTARVLLSLKPQLSVNLTNLFKNIRSNCSNSVFIDYRENVDLVTKHLNQLAGRKFILKGQSDQSEYKNSIAWIVPTYFGQKHILTARLERFLESGIFGYIKSVLKSYRKRQLKKEGVMMAAEAKPLGLNTNIVLIFFVHFGFCALLILVAFIKWIVVDLIGIALYVYLVVRKFLS